MPIKLDCVEFCKTLADPTRQKILEMLLEKEITVNEIVEAFDLSQPTVSHHLEILTRNGLANQPQRRQAGVLPHQPGQCGELLRDVDVQV